jgi:ATP-dependent protease ClpP protease subunit
MDGTRSLVTNGELLIYGIIDPSSMFEDSVRAIDVIDSITKLPATGDIKVRINSPGGSLVEGVAIYNALRGSGRRVVVTVDAMAASAASIIAMAGDEIVMADGATMMIHDPYAMVAGDSEALREYADVLDMQRDQMAGIYAKRTGLPVDEIIILMKAETYMSAAEAVERGFATRVAEPMKIAACALLSKEDLTRLFLASPKPLAEKHQPAKSTKEEKPVVVRAEIQKPAIITTKPAADAAPTEKEPVMTQAATAAAGSEAAAQAPDLVAIRAEATTAERTRVHSISAAVRAAKLEPSFADEMIRDGVTVHDARAKIIDKWAESTGADTGGNHTTLPRADIVNDAVDRWREGATLGVLARARLLKGDEVQKAKGNEFVGMTLAELARSSLSIRNIKSGHQDRMSMVGAAFTVRAAGPGYHSTSDFGNVLSTAAYRAMLTGYNEIDETFPLWTGKGTASDFRPISRVDMGLFPSLSKIEEGAEYTYATLGDTGTVVQVATYGKMFAITRQAIINDDLQFFDRVPRRMGRAAKRTIGNLVYGVINGNPTMQDGVALFHATHTNLAGTAAVPSVTSIGAGQAAMAVQKDDSGVGTGGGTAPKFMLVPPTLLMTTNMVVTSERIPGDAGQIANPIRGLVTPVSDSRLSGTAWYLAADPAQTDTIEVTYLDGVEEPFLDQKEGWDVDGSEFKVRMDAGVKALHWRGLYKNAGL